MLALVISKIRLWHRFVRTSIKTWPLVLRISLVLFGFAAVSLVFVVVMARSVHMEYETPVLRLVLNDRSLMITHFPDELASFRQAESASEPRIEYLGISELELDRLKQMVDQEGFGQLDASYGAPADQKYYPYRLRVVVNGTDKTVLYRSNPAWPGPPKAFLYIERTLLRLSGNTSSKTGVDP